MIRQAIRDIKGWAYWTLCHRWSWPLQWKLYPIAYPNWMGPSISPGVPSVRELICHIIKYRIWKEMGEKL